MKAASTKSLFNSGRSARLAFAPRLRGLRVACIKSGIELEERVTAARTVPMPGPICERHRQLIDATRASTISVGDAMRIMRLFVVLSLSILLFTGCSPYKTNAAVAAQDDHVPEVSPSSSAAGEILSFDVKLEANNSKKCVVSCSNGKTVTAACPTNKACCGNATTCRAWCGKTDDGFSC